MGTIVSNHQFPSLIVSMHTASRLFIGITFLLTAVLNRSVVLALLQLSLFILVLLIYADGWRRILRAMTLLRWLLLPIILLHALFTPGALIIAGMAWPVSVEGLQAGFWFSLHLLVIFFAAMLFSQLLTRREWISVVLKTPLLGRAILPYALLMNRCWQRIRLMLSDEYEIWRSEKRGLRSLLLHLGAMPVHALRMSREVASDIWRDWDQQVMKLTDAEGKQHVSVVATVSALSIAMLMWSVMLVGAI